MVLLSRGIDEVAKMEEKIEVNKLVHEMWITWLWVKLYLWNQQTYIRWHTILQKETSCTRNISMNPTIWLLTSRVFSIAVTILGVYGEEMAPNNVNWVFQISHLFLPTPFRGRLSWKTSRNTSNQNAPFLVFVLDIPVPKTVHPLHLCGAICRV